MSSIKPPTTNYISSTQSLINLIAASSADPSLLATQEEGSEESSEEDDVMQHEDILNSSNSINSTNSTNNTSLRPTLSRNQSASTLVKQLALDQSDLIDDAVFKAQEKGDINTQTFTEEPTAIDEEQNSVERLEQLVEEFGKWSDDSEKFLQSIPGALYRGVLIKGIIALTNRRLFFFAFVPPLEHSKSIRSGPITIHFPGVFKKSLRAWVDLSDDSVTWYKSSSTLYSPLGACRLSQLKEILPYNEDEPYIVRINLIDGRKRILELDTSESAISWRADLEATVFTFRSTADRLRFSLPLQRIKKVLVTPYMALAEKVEVNFDAGICEGSNGSGNEKDDVQSTSDLTTIEFGYIKSHHDFSIELETQVELSFSETKFCGGVEPILEIDSEIRKGDKKLQEQQEAEEKLDSTATTPSSSCILGLTRTDSDSINVNNASKLNLAKKFIESFALEDEPNELFLIPHVDLVRTLPTAGSLVLSKTFLCFWRRTVLITDTKLRIPLVDLDSVSNCKAFGFRIFGLLIQVRGAPDVRFDFHSKKLRDLTVSTLSSIILTKQQSQAQLHSSDSSYRSSEDSKFTSASSPPLSSLNTNLSHLSLDPSNPNSPLTPPSSTLFTSSGSPYTMNPVRSPFEASVHRQTILGQDLEEHVNITPGAKKFSMPPLLGSIGGRKLTGLKFVCLTIGSRGDVQPYVALGRELIKDGNEVTIASHPEYRDWVESFGICFKEVGGDPAQLMKLSVEHTIFSPGWFKESLGSFRGWLDTLFLESYEACKGADILIESPSTFAGIHVAEGLGIPYFRAFTMPWSSTASYPHAFGASVELGPTYNQLSYAIFDGIIWKAMSGQINRFRKETLNLPPTSLHKMSSAKTPFIYNFSTAVVPKPNDWRDFICISGYWFLDDEKLWSPPVGLIEFIEKARLDGKKIIYVGFGSIIVNDAAEITRNVIRATKNSDVRVILSKGWSERKVSNNNSISESSETHVSKSEEPILPPEIFSVASIQHDRLFPLIDAAVHHGGAGTTGASLRAGLPTLIHPFFGDQFFWASRVTKLKAGLKIDTLSEKDLTYAFTQGTTDRIMKEKAQIVGEKIRSENGTRVAISFITEHVHLAQERNNLRAARARKEKNKSIVHTRTFSSSGPSRSNSPSAGNSNNTTPRPLTPTFSKNSFSSSSNSAPLVHSPGVLSNGSETGSVESTAAGASGVGGSGFKWCPKKNSMRRKESLRIEKEKEKEKEEKEKIALDTGVIVDQNNEEVLS